MPNDHVLELLNRRVELMAELDALDTEADDLIAIEQALAQEINAIDIELPRYQATTPEGKAVSAALLEFEIEEHLDLSPVQAGVIRAYLANLCRDLPRSETHRGYTEGFPEPIGQRFEILDRRARGLAGHLPAGYLTTS